MVTQRDRSVRLTVLNRQTVPSVTRTAIARIAGTLRVTPKVRNERLAVPLRTQPHVKAPNRPPRPKAQTGEGLEVAIHHQPRARHRGRGVAIATRTTTSVSAHTPTRLTAVYRYVLFVTQLIMPGFVAVDM